MSDETTGLSKKFIGYKAVVCGDTIEFFWYDKPFYADFVRQYEIQRGDADEDFEKRFDNLTRARRDVRQVVLSNLTPHTKILTLTYKKTVLSFKEFNRDFTTFVQKMKREGVKLNYLYVIERQLERGKKEGNEGCIHAHLIIFNDEIIPMSTLKKAWPHGRLEIHVLNGLRYSRDEVGRSQGEKIKNAGAYLCKYITKEAQKEFNSHVYRCSKGLKRPVEHKFYTYTAGKYDYVTDDYRGFNELRNYCYDDEYKYEQRIFYESDGKPVTNCIHCTQVQIKPEHRQQVLEFVKRFPDGREIIDKVDVK